MHRTHKRRISIFEMERIHSEHLPKKKKKREKNIEMLSYGASDQNLKIAKRFCVQMLQAETQYFQRLFTGAKPDEKFLNTFLTDRSHMSQLARLDSQLFIRVAAVSYELPSPLPKPKSYDEKMINAIILASQSNSLLKNLYDLVCVLRVSPDRNNIIVHIIVTYLLLCDLLIFENTWEDHPFKDLLITYMLKHVTNKDYCALMPLWDADRVEHAVSVALGYIEPIEPKWNNPVRKVLTDPKLINFVRFYETLSLR